MKIKILAIILIWLLNACSSAPKSILMGAATGGAIGLGVGQAQFQNSKGTAISLLIGAGLGSLIGYWSFNGKQKKETSSNENKENVEELAPFLTKPKIRSYIVPDTIEGNKYIKSHRVFILEDPGSWSR